MVLEIKMSKNKHLLSYCWTGLGSLLTLVPLTVHADISGKVFRDFNANGTLDTGASFNEVGQAGITVKAFDATGTEKASATSGADGSYALTGLTSGADYRLEFSWVESWLKSGANGGTSVQFVKDGVANANFALLDPNEYAQSNPYVVIPRYIKGDPTAASNIASQIGLYAFPFDATSPNENTQTPLPVGKASIGQVGATWGVAYQRNTKTLYASAVLRRQAGFGPLGIGGIYKVDMSSPATASAGTSSLSYVDLKAIGIPVGDDPREPTGCNSLATDITGAAHDAASWNAVGKVGVGGLTMDNDHNRLWLVNLADKKLYGIQNVNPSSSPSATDVLGGYTIALPTGYACTDGELRPWGVTYHHDKVYVGAVCDGSLDSSGDAGKLAGYILNFDPANPANGFNVEHTFALNSLRSGYGGDHLSTWQPWNDAASISTPLIGGIEFDVDGSVMVGVIDRLSLQLAPFNYSKDCNSTVFDVADGSFGDVMRFCKSGNTYLNDGGAGCSTAIPSALTASANGVTQTEYYWGEHGPIAGSRNDFNETAQGALAFLPGAGHLLSSGLDATDYYQGGVYWLNNQTGGATQRYFIYQTADSNSGTMGKVVGLGDMEVLADPAPIEIGNRVWLDTDKDGIQDAGEAGIANVQVKLTCGADNATATTGSDGSYYFSNASGGNATFMNASESCVLSIASGQSALTGYSITTQNADSVTDNGANTDIRDSDATTAGEIAFTVGNAGENNHGLDFGYQTETVQNSTLDQAGCAAWLSNATLDDGSAAVGKDFVWAVNNSAGVVLMDMGAAKVQTGTPSFPVGVRTVNLSTVIDQPSLLSGMGSFDVAADGTTYMAAAPDMGILTGGNNVIKISPAGVVTTIATINTTNAGFGDVYAANGYVYVSNLGDGKIYKINPTASDPNTSFTAVYDHGLDGRTAAGLSPVVDADKGNGWNFVGTLGGRRVTALFVDGTKLFYGVMWRDNSDIQSSWYKDGTAAKTAFDAKATSSNWAMRGELWSVTLDASGNPIASTATLLVDQSSLTTDREDAPIADLTINKDGKLIVGTAPYNYSGMQAQHYGGVFALTKNSLGAFTVYEPYTDIPDGEGNGALDAFAERVLIGGEYNVQNGRAYGFADISQVGTGSNDIYVGVPDSSTTFYNGFGTSFNGLSNGSTGDIEYLCSDNSTPVEQKTDLKLSKVASSVATQRGATLTFTLTLTNESSVAATGVTVTDHLPSGLQFVSATGDGSYDGNTGLWDVGDVAASASKTLNITVRVQ